MVAPTVSEGDLWGGIIDNADIRASLVEDMVGILLVIGSSFCNSGGRLVLNIIFCALFLSYSTSIVLILKIGPSCAGRTVRRADEKEESFLGVNVPNIVPAQPATTSSTVYFARGHKGYWPRRVLHKIGRQLSLLSSH